jgi:methanogenic corrinoid protein MtbC1
MHAMISEAVYLHYLDALLEGDKKECSRIVSDLFNEGIPSDQIYLKLFQRSMYRVGLLWEKNRICIGKEHMATKITECLVNTIFTKAKKADRIHKTVLITCVDKEFHELGAKIVSDYFELHGWDSVFLGANTPTDEVMTMIREKEPEVVGISINFYINVVRLVKLIEEINNNFPFQKIIVGGQAMSNGNHKVLDKFDNVDYISSFESLQNFLNTTE